MNQDAVSEILYLPHPIHPSPFLIGWIRLSGIGGLASPDLNFMDQGVIIILEPNSNY